MTVLHTAGRTALVIVDLQQGTTSNPLVHPVEDVVAGCVRLAAAFRAARLPVVLVNAEGAPPGRTTYGPRPQPEGWADLVPELSPTSSDLLVTKEGWSALTGTNLHERLLDLGVTELVLAGLATSYGVESTARSAYDLGYHVVVATDAVSDVSVAGHEGSLARVYPALGTLATTDEIVHAIDRPPTPSSPLSS